MNGKCRVSFPIICASCSTKILRNESSHNFLCKNMSVYGFSVILSLHSRYFVQLEKPIAPKKSSTLQQLYCQQKAVSNHLAPCSIRLLEVCWQFTDRKRCHPCEPCWSCTLRAKDSSNMFVLNERTAIFPELLGGSLPVYLSSFKVTFILYATEVVLPILKHLKCNLLQFNAQVESSLRCPEFAEANAKRKLRRVEWHWLEKVHFPSQSSSLGAL